MYGLQRRRNPFSDEDGHNGIPAVPYPWGVGAARKVHPPPSHAAAAVQGGAHTGTGSSLPTIGSSIHSPPVAATAAYNVSGGFLSPDISASSSDAARRLGESTEAAGSAMSAERTAAGSKRANLSELSPFERTLELLKLGSAAVFSGSVAGPVSGPTIRPAEPSLGEAPPARPLETYFSPYPKGSAGAGGSPSRPVRFQPKAGVFPVGSPSRSIREWLTPTKLGPEAKKSASSQPHFGNGMAIEDTPAQTPTTLCRACSTAASSRCSSCELPMCATHCERCERCGGNCCSFCVSLDLHGKYEERVCAECFEVSRSQHARANQRAGPPDSMDLDSNENGFG